MLQLRVWVCQLVNLVTYSYECEFACLFFFCFIVNDMKLYYTWRNASIRETQNANFHVASTTTVSIRDVHDCHISHAYSSMNAKAKSYLRRPFDLIILIWLEDNLMWLLYLTFLKIWSLLHVYHHARLDCEGDFFSFPDSMKRIWKGWDGGGWHEVYGSNLYAKCCLQ